MYYRPYFLAFISLLLVCGSQYVLSLWFISIGYYHWYYYPLGGFLFWMMLTGFVSMKLEALFLKDENKRNAQERNAATIAFKGGFGMTFLVSFGIAISLIPFREKYEYDHYGKKVEAVVSRKYVFKGKAKYYYCVFSFDNGIKKDSCEICVDGGVYKSKNIGDTATIMYSSRNKNYAKLVP